MSAEIKFKDAIYQIVERFACSWEAGRQRARRMYEFQKVRGIKRGNTIFFDKNSLEEYLKGEANYIPKST